MRNSHALSLVVTLALAGLAIGGLALPASALPNPSAVYAQDLGYPYVVRGDCAFVVLPDSTECPAWAFFEGRCGQEWTLGGQQGARVESRRGGPYSSYQAICIFPDGTERPEVALWFELREEQGKEPFGSTKPARWCGTQ